MNVRRPGTCFRRLAQPSGPGVASAMVILMAVSCAHHHPIARPYPPPTATELARVLAARQKAVSSMNARVRATSWLGGDRVRATVLMLVERPGPLRLEAEVSLQGTVAILATDGQRFAFLDMQKNELRRGLACPANVASLIRIPLGPADVAAILLGDVLLPVDTAAGTVDWDPNVGADVLVVRRDDGWLKLILQSQGAIGTESRLVGASATGPDGRTRWRVAFEDFTDVDPATRGVPAARVSLPRTIRFAEYTGSFDDGVEVKFKERTLNGEAAPGAFTLTAPTGTAIVDVACPPAASLAPVRAVLPSVDEGTRD